MKRQETNLSKPKSIGDLLGGVGNAVIPVIIKNINIRLSDNEFAARIAWSLIEEVPPLLGRIDIFDKFEIIFMQKEKNVVFYPNS